MTRATTGGSFGVRKVATRAEQKARKVDCRVALTIELGIVCAAGTVGREG